MKGKPVKMKIKSLKITGLYNLYNYNINFFDDVTFLHGSNGSGKTTILNILNSIINSDMNYLWSLDFEKLKLEYYNPYKNDFGNIIYEKTENMLTLLFKDYICEMPQEMFSQKKQYIFKMKSFTVVFNEIKELFPKVFLPLIRKDRRENVFNKFYRRDLFDDFDDEMDENPISDIDKALKDVEKVIFNYSNKVLQKLSENDKNLRDDLLSKTLINDNVNINSILENLLKMSAESFEKLTKEYEDSLKTINNLMGLRLTSSNIFKDLFCEFQKYKTKNNELTVPLIVNFYKIIQAKEIIKLTSEHNEKKLHIMHKIDKFKEVIDSFFSMGSMPKKLSINRGLSHITFKVGNQEKEIEISQLSSGEKQIFLFFSHLFFNLTNNDEGIFIVDEPEMSLHLEWQEIFVKTILEANNRIQLIFATHSPEIISEYLKKSVRLIPFYLKNENNDMEV